MKKNPNNLARLAVATAAVVACCSTARADLGTVASTTNTLASWQTENGSGPFYYAQDLHPSTGESGDSPPGAASGATYNVLSETFSITNGAGFVLPNGATNYVVSGIGLLVSGYGTNPMTIHLFDITSNLTGAVTASSCSYGFTANGDLLGNGSGLSWVNSQNSGAEQQDFLPLSQGPNSYDQVVLAAGHIYAFEIWEPTTGGDSFFWEKDSAAGDVDPGGLAMGSANSKLTVNRTTISALGQVGSSEHCFALALYGGITSAAGSVNTNINTAATTNYIVDEFNSYGYGPTNAYVGTNDYNTGGISNVWGNWFGSAWVSNSWAANEDAGGNPNSGSLQITANFQGTSNQYVVFDEYTGITPALNALTLGITSFQCDVLFDPSSTTQTNASVLGGAPFYGSLQFGLDYPSPTFNSQDFYPGVFTIAAGTTNWTHITIPLNPTTDPNLESINDVLIHIYGPETSPALQGTSILYVDNVKFVGPATPPPPPPPPVVKIQTAKPGLRIFAASSANTYDRQELDTTDQNQSWLSGHFPVTYSFTLLDFPVAPGMQCHLFLVPVSSLPTGNAATGNEFVDYQASNNVWLYIDGGGLNPTTGQAGYTVQLLWKTNLANANAANEALIGGTYTNTASQSAVGTWSLTFNNANSGTLTPPGASPLAFTINDANITSDFANPVIALIGLQPNSTGGEGTYIDYGAISITGVADGPEVENFTAEPSGNSIITSGLWDVSDSQAGANTTALQLVTSGTPLWVYWTLPDVDFALGVSPGLPINTAPGYNYPGPPYNGINSLVLPSQFNGYYTQPLAASRAGGTNWDLIPSICLPSNLYPALTNQSYFQLVNPGPAN